MTKNRQVEFLWHRVCRNNVYFLMKDTLNIKDKEKINFEEHFNTEYFGRNVVVSQMG